MRTAVLSDIIELIGGGTPKTNKPEFWSGDIPWLSVVDFGGDRRWVDQTEKAITSLGLESSSTKLLNKGDIIISARGTVGELAQLRRPMAFNQSCYGIRAKAGVDQNFLYYLLKKSVNDLRRQSHGGVFNTITRSTFDVVSVSIPNLETQKKIANILGSLDEKIELNRRMNETLEQLGQALFRHYFVDKTKQSNGNIRTIPLGKKFHPKRGRSLQARDMICGDTPVISGGLKPAGFHNEANTTAPVITISASGANAGFVSVWGEPVWSADSSYIDSTITKYVYTYYLFLKNKQKEIYDMQTGSGQPHIYPKHIELLEIADLSDCEFNDFEQRVRPLFDMIHKNKKQIDYLSNIRDLLLPKLISGEIEIWQPN
ncbi:restriction endonuclease subunit S [Candidatus Saccharibacteria bacterium oral taxon 488]|jgi:putative type I site-specific deoxyribonuclease|nr:restriction endonuclease subunit S [Candidatus Saccharibacteria bacterium oral taxon 488]QJU10497.1 restriction endonuclease subunit S [Candidatus Saccharibacteria bacterium oral taxon 488]